MKLQDVTSTIEIKNLIATEQYEVIEKEFIKDYEYNDLTISGSLFTETKMSQVTFKNCIFYGSQFRNSSFLGCKFENCEFRFSTIAGCNFIAAEFQNCTWAQTRFKDSKLSSCFLDAMTLQTLGGTQSNLVEDCYSSRDLLELTKKIEQVA